MRRLALIALTGCGRLGFEDVALAGDAADADADVDAIDAMPDARPGCTVHVFDTAPPGYQTYGGGTVTFTGRLAVGIPGGQNIDAGVRGTTPRSFVGREVSVEVVKILDHQNGLTAFGWHDANTNQSAHLYVSDGDLIVERFTPPDVYLMPNRVPYQPAQHRWWQLREMSGAIRAYTSPDGAAWTQFGAVPSFPTLTDVYADIGADTPFTAIPADTASFDNLVDCDP